MFCIECNNILTKITDTNELKFVCVTCGNEYAANGRDTLISNVDKKNYSMSKSGKVIYYYNSNPKVLKPCEKCTSKIVAYEIDAEMNRMYGCACGYSWKETIKS